MASDALVMPSRTDSAVGGLAAGRDRGLVGLGEDEAVGELARQEVGVAGVEHGDLAHHLAAMTSMCLSLMSTPWDAYTSWTSATM